MLQVVGEYGFKYNYQRDCDVNSVALSFLGYIIYIKEIEEMIFNWLFTLKDGMALLG